MYYCVLPYSCHAHGLFASIPYLVYEHSPLPHSHKDAIQKEKESINLKPQDTLIEDTPQQTPVESGGWFGAWHFLIIFLLIAALVGIGYFCSHNRKKVCTVLYCAWHSVVEPSWAEYNQRAYGWYQY